ncbi:MAG: 1-acyl-sn-glycerol-3-phosphate acyltransferase, partial [Elusimicrobia bacterium]|nr:1-acyl-sn-glycerol-3-phosphate acyltransferase [Elusimicrobiota bacterium]
SGLDYVPRTGRVLVAANHKSNWDPLLLGTVLGRIRRPYALAKAELFRNPLLGFLLDRWGAVRLCRQGADVGALKNAIALLTLGEMLIVFPEGTRKRENRLERFLPGIGYLSLKTQAPVVPVYISDFGRFPKLGSEVQIRFGKPLLPKAGRPGDIAREVLNKVRELAGEDDHGRK